VEHAQICIACRDDALRVLLSEVLRRDGHALLPATDRKSILKAVSGERPDLLLLDADAGLRSLEILLDVQSRNREVGILLLVWETDPETAAEAVRLGVSDFITKPVDREQVPLRVAVALERRKLAVSDRQYRLALEQRINVRTKEVWEKKERLRRQLMSTVEALAQSLAAKHRYTEGHSRRVTEVAIALARAMKMPPEELRAVELAARFHDIGKIGVRDDVLNKAGSLDETEYAHVKTHPLVAERILGPIEDFVSVLPLVKHEHERYDGTGYPEGLKGKSIPMGSRIIAIADAFDALVTDRVYRRGGSPEAALKEIRRCAGSQFDPDLIEIFGRLVRSGAVKSPALPARVPVPKGAVRARKARRPRRP
jgi:response regulator RpfG family c-di-GMP phosphodiesterase